MRLWPERAGGEGTISENIGGHEAAFLRVGYRSCLRTIRTAQNGHLLKKGIDGRLWNETDTIDR